MIQDSHPTTVPANAAGRATAATRRVVAVPAPETSAPAPSYAANGAPVSAHPPKGGGADTEGLAGGDEAAPDRKLDFKGIPDVQGRGDTRGIPLQRAGVTGLRYPATAIDPEGVERPTIAELELSVSVPAESKGTHMSRFVQLVQEDSRRMCAASLVRIAREMRELLDADSGRIAVRVPLFFERAAPVSGARGLVDVGCGLTVELHGDRLDLVERVEVTVTSLCPCSKEISEYGAHNQRGIITIEVRAARDASDAPLPIPVGDLIHAAEESASCRVYPVLKRPDERWVTMEAYENPVFVEDMVRGVAARLMADERVAWFRVHARNLESIHGHDAFAETEWSR
jgi:GTP cyclohydrolase I